MVIGFGPRSFFDLEIKGFTAPDGDGVCNALAELTPIEYCIYKSSCH